MRTKTNGIPDFFIVGATKCATSSIYQQLSSHKSLCMSIPKEPRILESDVYDWERHYSKVFRHFKTGNLTGDCNPNNLIIRYVPERIKIINKNAKIIIIVREPVSRAYSHWKYFYNMRPGRERPFALTMLNNIKEFNTYKFKYESDYVPWVCQQWGNYKPMYIETGAYIEYIIDYKKIFKDVLILFYEDYAERPQTVINSICDFLNVEKIKVSKIIRNKTELKSPYRNNLSEIKGEYPNMHKTLSDFYIEYNRELFKLTNREKWVM